MQYEENNERYSWDIIILISGHTFMYTNTHLCTRGELLYMHEFWRVWAGRVGYQVASSLVDAPAGAHECLLAARLVGQMRGEQLLQLQQLDGAVHIPVSLLQSIHAVLHGDLPMRKRHWGNSAHRQSHLHLICMRWLTSLESTLRISLTSSHNVSWSDPLQKQERHLP